MAISHRSIPLFRIVEGRGFGDRADRQQHTVANPAGAVAPEIPDGGEQLGAHRDKTRPNREAGAQPFEPQLLAAQAKLPARPAPAGRPLARPPRCPAPPSFRCSRDHERTLFADLGLQPAAAGAAATRASRHASRGCPWPRAERRRTLAGDVVNRDETRATGRGRPRRAIALCDPRS